MPALFRPSKIALASFAGSLALHASVFVGLVLTLSDATTPNRVEIPRGEEGVRVVWLMPTETAPVPERVTVPRPPPKIEPQPVPPPAPVPVRKKPKIEPPSTPPPATPAPVKPARSKPQPPKAAPPKTSKREPTKEASRKTSAKKTAAKKTASKATPVAKPQRALAKPEPKPVPAAARPAGVRKGARVKRQAMIDYPLRCRRRGHEGVAHVTCTIDARGRVRAVQLKKSAGCDRLDRAALDAARQTVFLPATVDGKATRSTRVLPVEFRLR